MRILRLIKLVRSAYNYVPGSYLLQFPQWTDNCQRELDKVKEYVTRPLGLQPFVPDFSALGIGLVLAQRDPQDLNKRRLMWMESTKLTKTKTQ